MTLAFEKDSGERKRSFEFFIFRRTAAGSSLSGLKSRTRGRAGGIFAVRLIFLMDQPVHVQ